MGKRRPITLLKDYGAFLEASADTRAFESRFCFLFPVDEDMHPLTHSTLTPEAYEWLERNITLFRPSAAPMEEETNKG